MPGKYGVLAFFIAVLMLFCAACEIAAKEDVQDSPNARPSANEPPAGTARPEPTAIVERGFGIGKSLPVFSVPTVEGGTFTLSENTGKPVFINLFATWCGPCVYEMPDINRLYGELGDEVTFIIVDIGEDSAAAQAFAEGNGYSLPFAYSPDGALFSDYDIEYIPQTFILDADGTIVEFFGGASDYERFLEAVRKAMKQ